MVRVRRRGSLTLVPPLVNASSLSSPCFAPHGALARVALRRRQLVPEWMWERRLVAVPVPGAGRRRQPHLRRQVPVSNCCRWGHELRSSVPARGSSFLAPCMPHMS